MKKFLIGIDVSKEKLDACLTNQGEIKEEKIVGNQSTLIKSYLQGVLKENNLNADDLLICAEYTGQYTYPLCCVCQGLGIDLWLKIQHKLNIGQVFNEEKMTSWMLVK